MPVKRLDRINEEVKKTLSEIIRELKDPRISPMTTILMAEVTNDYKHAKVRVSVYDKDDSVREETVKALNYAKGFIARELGKRMDIRRLPELHFTLDSSIEYSVHISDILEELKRNRKPQEEIPDDADTQED
ncbi:MAG: 30S ribosome-binding factor RbfA [Clostridia bacterium]|nr:30S ribosome-binding factor RbfA [Clostridia bacterium]